MRVRLAGKGSPIPGLAIPDPNSGDNIPQTYIFADGEEFHKADWIGLGFTHYEAWCVGAAGGRGGAQASNTPYFPAVRTRPVMTPAEWDLYLELMIIYASMLQPPYGPYGQFNPPTYQPAPQGVINYYESQFPAHDPWYVSNYYPAAPAPFMVETSVQGGGGGGGGAHRVGGLLADLPEVVVAEVGVRGANAPHGQTVVNGVYTPIPDSLRMYDPPDGRLQELNNWATEFMNEYPVGTRVGFVPPGPGEDGGYSAFGDICKASGGKGGRPAKVWNGTEFVPDAAGGQGGAGDTIVAGGGGTGTPTGTTAQPPNGQDGTWDGTIGKGGGGGRGGVIGSPGNSFPYYSPPIPPRLPSSGGRGSFSYADTSIHGPRGAAGFWVQQGYDVDYYTGVVTPKLPVQTSAFTVPGTGGGAKADKKLKYGSHAIGFSPDGLCMIRIYAVE